MKKLSLIRLEERIVLDAAGAATIDPLADGSDAPHVEPAHGPDPADADGGHDLQVVALSAREADHVNLEHLDNVLTVVFGQDTDTLDEVVQELRSALDGQKADAIYLSSDDLAAMTGLGEDSLLDRPELSGFLDDVHALLDSGGDLNLLDTNPADAAPVQVVVIDSQVDNYQQLLDTLDGTPEFIVIDQGVDGLAFLAGQLEGRSDIDTVHILSHGSEGELFLGSAVLDADSMDGYHDDLAALGASLTQDGDILIYGCDVGQGVVGDALVRALAQATGADVAASDDPTGHESLGGDWDLETRSGIIDGPGLFVPEYVGLLANGANNDSYSNVQPGTTVDLNVLNNDNDGLLWDPSLVSVTTPTFGTAVIDGDVIRFTSAGSDSGTATFQYTAQFWRFSLRTGWTSYTGTATVNVELAQPNRAPTANDDSDSTSENSTERIYVRNNDSDPDGDHLHVTSVTTPAGFKGQVTISGNSHYVTYDPDGQFEYLNRGESATETFEYTIDDGNGHTDTAQVTVTINGRNDDPVANDDTATVAEDGSVLIDVLANDTDVDNDASDLSIHAASLGILTPFHGQVQVEGNQIRYTPDADYNGADGFWYTVEDGDGGYDSAWVDVTVTPVNDAPVLNVTTSDPVDYTENGDPVMVFWNDLNGDGDKDGGENSFLTLYDVDDTYLEHAGVAVMDFVSGDVLGWDAALASAYGLTVTSNYNWGPYGTGLRIEGTATVAQYRSFLETITYSSTSDNPDLGGTDTTRTIGVVVHDGDSYNVSNPVQSRVVNILPENDAPVLEVTATEPVDFTENGNPVMLFWNDLDGDGVKDDGEYSFLTLYDVDDTNLEHAGVAVMDFVSGDVLGWDAALASTYGLTVTDSYDWGPYGTGLRIEGTATVEQYRTFLETITYSSTSDNPDTYGTDTTRTVGVVVHDGSTYNISTPVQSRDVNILAVNDAPVLAITDPTPVGYTENQPGVLVFDGDLGVSDVDDTHLEWAGVTIGDFEDGDFLTWDEGLRQSLGLSVTLRENWTDINGHDWGTGYQFTGSATPAEYQAFLETIRYGSTSDDPTLGGSNPDRTIYIGVHDGDSWNVSNPPMSRTVEITALNDAPVIDPGEVDDFAPITEDDTYGDDPNAWPAGWMVDPTFANTPTLVSDLLDGSIADPDSADSHGIAIHDVDEENGNWWYSTDDGTTWQEIPTTGILSRIDPGHALLLEGDDLLVFVPDAENGGQSSISYHAWDMTDGHEGGDFAALAYWGRRGFMDWGWIYNNVGGENAYSESEATSSIQVADVNDAPVMHDIRPLVPILEDPLLGIGQYVHSLFGQGLIFDDDITDVDDGAVEGIAIIGLDDTNGHWEYRLTENGIAVTDWLEVGGVDMDNALLLGAWDMLRFVPDTENGSPLPVDADTMASITVLAWDQTSYQGQDFAPGMKVDIDETGGTTPFSDVESPMDATIYVQNLNDRPVLDDSLSDPATPGDPVNDLDYLGLITEDGTDFDNASGDAIADPNNWTEWPPDNQPITVNDILGGDMSDVDDPAFLAGEGIALTGVNEVHGTWWYQKDAPGAQWIMVGSPGEDGALLLKGTDKLLYVPDGANGTPLASADAAKASLTFRAWDQSFYDDAYTAGTLVDVSDQAFRLAALGQIVDAIAQLPFDFSDIDPLDLVLLHEYLVNTMPDIFPEGFGISMAESIIQDIVASGMEFNTPEGGLNYGNLVDFLCESAESWFMAKFDIQTLSDWLDDMSPFSEDDATAILDVEPLNDTPEAANPDLVPGSHPVEIFDTFPGVDVITEQQPTFTFDISDVDNEDSALGYRIVFSATAAFPGGGTITLPVYTYETTNPQLLEGNPDSVTFVFGSQESLANGQYTNTLGQVVTDPQLPEDMVISWTVQVFDHLYVDGGSLPRAGEPGISGPVAGEQFMIVEPLVGVQVSDNFTDTTYPGEKEGLENEEPVISFTVDLEHWSDEVITVDFVIDGGFELADIDLANISYDASRITLFTDDSGGLDNNFIYGQITFQPGETSQTIELPVLDDQLDEITREQVTMTLSNPVNADLHDVVNPFPGDVQITNGTPDFQYEYDEDFLAQETDTYEIIDDAGDTSFIYVNDTTLFEDEGPAIVTFTKVGASEGPVTIWYLTSDGTAVEVFDYEAASGSLTWHNEVVGDLSVEIPLVDDITYEYTESFFVNIVAIDGNGAVAAEGDIDALPGVDGVGEVTILDNDLLITEQGPWNLGPSGEPNPLSPAYQPEIGDSSGPASSYATLAGALNSLVNRNNPFAPAYGTDIRGPETYMGDAQDVRESFDRAVDELPGDVSQRTRDSLKELNERILDIAFADELNADTIPDLRGAVNDLAELISSLSPSEKARFRPVMAIWIQTLRMACRTLETTGVEVADLLEELTRLETIMTA